MMPTGNCAASIQEGVKIIIVLVDNKGFASIGGLSHSLGMGGFGTTNHSRSSSTGQLDGELFTVDYVANASSLGAYASKAVTLHEFKEALEQAKSFDRTTVIVVESDPSVHVPNYESWWDVAVPEVSKMDGVRKARTRYEDDRKLERYLSVSID